MFETAHVERVIRHLVRFGSSRADAEDLAQEALVIAWRKQGELDRDRSLDAWLYGIARNVYRNHVRSQRRKAMSDESPEPTADARDLAEVVAFRDALGALPEPQQDIVILHELEEYTLKETAELLAIPFDTAKDRLRRAREGLREAMHVDLAAVAARERRATSQIAKAAAPAVALGLLAATSRSAAAATATTTITSKLVLLGVLAAGISIGVVAHRLVANPSVQRDVPREAPIIATTTVPIDAPSAPDAAESLGVVAPDASAPPATPDPEAKLVESARVALRHGAADEAIRTLMGHERRFPTGQLAEERDVLLVEAYLAAGNAKLARERLEHYRATYPHGVHADRADAAEREIERRESGPLAH